MVRLLYKYDAFLSHAVEDNFLIANELSERLRESGLKIWYSGNELIPGKDITEQIHFGLKNSRHGIFILSPNFMEKEWPKREYYILLSRERKNEKIIFPVLFRIKPEELTPIDPGLIDRYGIDAGKGMDVIVEKLTKAIKKNKGKRRTRIVITIVLLSLISMSFYFFSPKPESKKPSTELIENTIRQRVASLESKLNTEHVLIPTHDAIRITSKEIEMLSREFRHQKSHYRNEYEFFAENINIRSRKNVEKYLHIDPSSILPGIVYKVADGILIEKANENFRELSYILNNTKAVTWSVSEPQVNKNDSYTIIVAYSNNFRLAHVTLSFAASPKDTRYNRVLLYGFPSEEHYHFISHDDSWSVEEVE